jgi:hypothetical protein
MGVHLPADPVRFEHQRTPSGTIRTLTRLTPHDAAAYAALVAKVTLPVEARLLAGVLANRATRGPAAIDPWCERRSTWRRSIRRALAARRPPTVLVADVQDFYPSVRPAVVARALRGARVDVWTSGAIERFLLELRDRGVRGLPVGPTPSCVLANAVLADADDALAGAGIDPLRWVDDVVAFAESPRAAARAFDAWRRQLEAVGLRAHPVKSVILVDRDEARARLLRSRPSDAEGPARGIIAWP